MRQSILFRKTYNLVTEDGADSKDGVADDELLQQGVHFTAKVCFCQCLTTPPHCAMYNEKFCCGI